MDKSEMDRIKDMFLQNIGAVIKKHRKEKHLTQDALADGIGQKRSSIGNYERGEDDIHASTMAKISVYLGFPLKEYTKDIINTEFGDKPEDIYYALIKINEAVRTEEIEKEMRKPVDEPFIEQTFADIKVNEQRQLTLQDYVGIGKRKPVLPPKPDVRPNQKGDGWEKYYKDKGPKQTKEYGYVKASEQELAEADMYLREETETMPLYKKASVANIYQAISTQIMEAQGDDVKELAQIARATLNYAMNEVPAKKKKKIQTYLDYMADGNLAYKYGEYPERYYEDRPPKPTE